MQNFNITMSRSLIRLKIKSLLKKKIVEENPMLVEYLLNTLSFSSDRLKKFEMASAGLLDKEYKSVGDTVCVKLSKIDNWSTRDSLKIMNEDPEKYGIDKEEGTIKGIIVECYYYDEYNDYCVAHPYVDDGKFTEHLVDVKESDLILE